MYNFPIEYEGQTYWRSRSCTVVGYVFQKNTKGEWFVLANQRGPGAPNNNGKWNVPCGYIDFNEDGLHAVQRETYEETGVKIDIEDWKFNCVTFSEEGEQNINLNYVSVLPFYTIEDVKFSMEHMEKDEVSDIKFIPLSDIDKYEWAFNHENRIKEYFNKFVNHV